MIGKLNEEEIENVISQQLLGRIGCHADGITYVVPVSYAYDGSYIYGHTFEGMKIDIMRKNPQVCFEVENTVNLSDWQTVIAWGEFEEIKDNGERKKAFQKLNERILPFESSETMHLGSQWPFPDDNVDKNGSVYYRIRLARKTGRFEKNTRTFTSPPDS